VVRVVNKLRLLFIEQTWKHATYPGEIVCDKFQIPDKIYNTGEATSRNVFGMLGRARLAINFSTDLVCISYAFDVLGVCVTITSRDIPSLVQLGVLIGGFRGTA
jgi:hypothetical protein